MTETKYSLAAGRLVEGKYFWIVRSLDASAKVLNAGRMNELSIAYDNAVQEIEIRAPRPGSTVSGKTLTTHGEVAIGSRLEINGNPANLDRKGRFQETIPVAEGSNHIVYRTVASGAVERFHLRYVTKN